MGKIVMHIFAALSLVLVVLVIGFAMYEGLLLYKYDMDPNYALIDRCLSTGGVWDSAEITCVSE